MPRVGSRDRHTRWRSKNIFVMFIRATECHDFFLTLFSLKAMCDALFNIYIIICLFVLFFCNLVLVQYILFFIIVFHSQQTRICVYYNIEHNSYKNLLYLRFRCNPGYYKSFMTFRGKL